MRRFMVFVMTLFFFFGSAQGYGAEKRAEKNPIPKAKTISETKSPQTTYHALIIGNNQYKYMPKLKTACNDAVEVEKLLKEKFNFQTELLLEATRTKILGKINEMRKRLGEKDSLLIYYAGHGEYDKTVDKSYWLPVDAQRDDPTNWIMADDITSNIKRIAAKHVLVVSDSCYSGTLSRQAVTELITTGEREGYIKKMIDRPSRTLMASGGNEPVSDSGGGNHSVFAAAFIKAMKESDKAQFTAEEIFHSRIKAIVAGKSEQVPEYSSIKNSGDEGGDFVFRLASLEIEAKKLEAAEKEKEAQRQKELQKLEEERVRLENERKRFEEQTKLVQERAKVAEEKARLEVKQKEAEEQSRRQQEAQQKLAEERTRLDIEKKRVEEERKLKESQRQKVEEEKQRLEEGKKVLAKKEVKKPALSPPLSEILALIPEYIISPPAPTDPPEVKALLGEWTGQWKGGRDIVLIVKSIDITEKRANVIYAWGDPSPDMPMSKSVRVGGPSRIVQVKRPDFVPKKGYSGYIAEFVPGENPIIKWKFGSEGSNMPKVEFVLKKDKLIGSWWYKSSTMEITMTKTP